MSVSFVYQILLTACIVRQHKVVAFAFLGPRVKGENVEDWGNHVISPQVDVESLRMGTISHFICLFAPEKWAGTSAFILGR